MDPAAEPMVEPPVAAGLSFTAAADLQDHLMTATNDLERLHTLLADAADTLQAGFFGTMRQMQDMRESGLATAHLLDGAFACLTTAITALQFQDMASQLIHHTRGRLRNCADRIARDSFAGDEDSDTFVAEAPLRPNPVTQSEMDTGYVELF